jgi:hypothetical protein
MSQLFPDVPDGLEALSAEELQGHIDALRARVAEVKTRDPEVVGDISMTELLNQVEAAVEKIEAISAVLATREAAETQFEEELSKLADKAGVAEADPGDEDDPDPAPEPEPVEPEVTAEVEPVVEEAAPEPLLVAGGAPAARPKLPAPAPANEPAEVLPPQPARAALVAASGIPGMSENASLGDRYELAKAVIAKRYQGTSVAKGVQEKVLIASANYGELFPEERKLRGDAQDSAKIEAVVSDEAITASGGLCAPVTNYYELMNVAVADRPVRDAMANFNAIRGGLKFAAPPTIADITGIGIKTAAQDALGGTYAAKSCQVVECPDFDEEQLAMIYHCLQFGNLNSRAFPEMVAHFNSLVLAAHARLAEQNLLDYVKSTATNVTDAGTYGSTASLLNAALFAGAGMRSRHRMAHNATFRALMPEWVGDQAAADMSNRQFTDFQFSRNDIGALLARQGVNVSWYKDTPTGAGQIFGTQNASALLRFPTTVKWAIYPEGSYLFLDGGTLDLGIVRDSTLNETNDFQIFGETFEAAAFIGVEALYVTSTVCANGTTAGTATAITCS